jgi:hypothetical protein
VFERKFRARHVASGRARWLKRTATSEDIPPADGAEGDAPYDEMKIAQATIYNELIQLCSGEGYSIVSNYECGQQVWEALQTH